jgi:hypothetical protein
LVIRVISRIFHIKKGNRQVIKLSCRHYSSKRLGFLCPLRKKKSNDKKKKTTTLTKDPKCRPSIISINYEPIFLSLSASAIKS